MAREYVPPEWSDVRDFEIPKEELYPYPEDQPQRTAEEKQERQRIEGQTWSEWWDEMHHQAKKAGSGQAFKEAVERDGGTLSRDEGNTITIHSPRGAYGTFVSRELVGAESDQAYENFMSTLDRTKLPGHIEAAQTHRMHRVREFWDLADNNPGAENYQKAIEQAGYVLAKQDDKILVVTKDCIVDDLSRLTPAIAGDRDISDYKKFIAPIAAQELPGVSYAQEIQDQRNDRDPELAHLLRALEARQYREALDLSDKHARQNWMTERNEQEREIQQEGFAVERKCYVEEYLESWRMREALAHREETEIRRLEQERDEGSGFSR